MATESSTGNWCKTSQSKIRRFFWAFNASHYHTWGRYASWYARFEPAPFQIWQLPTLPSGKRKMHMILRPQVRYCDACSSFRLDSRPLDMKFLLDHRICEYFGTLRMIWIAKRVTIFFWLARNWFLSHRKIRYAPHVLSSNITLLCRASIGVGDTLDTLSPSTSWSSSKLWSNSRNPQTSVDYWPRTTQKCWDTITRWSASVLFVATTFRSEKFCRRDNWSPDNSSRTFRRSNSWLGNYVTW